MIRICNDKKINNLSIDVYNLHTYNKEKEGAIMKDIIFKYHKKIDFISVWLFVFSVSLLVSIKIFSFIDDQSLYIASVIVFSFLVGNKNTVYFLNILLHRLFGFRR